MCGWKTNSLNAFSGRWQRTRVLGEHPTNIFVSEYANGINPTELPESNSSIATFSQYQSYYSCARSQMPEYICIINFFGRPFLVVVVVVVSWQATTNKYMACFVSTLFRPCIPLQWKMRTYQCNKLHLFMVANVQYSAIAKLLHQFLTEISIKLELLSIFQSNFRTIERIISTHK